MGRITGIGHVALKVHDLERSLAFYRDRLGFPEMMRMDHPDGGIWLVYLRITDTQFIEIFPGADSERAPGWNGNAITHVCLEVDDLDAVVEQVERAGIRLLIEKKDRRRRQSPGLDRGSGRQPHRIHAVEPRLVAAPGHRAPPRRGALVDAGGRTFSCKLRHAADFVLQFNNELR